MEAGECMILDEERRYYESQKSELLAACKNQYVLIKGSSLIGTFGDAESAYAEGLGRFGLQPFLVRQVLEEEPLGVAPILSLVPVDAGL